MNEDERAIRTLVMQWHAATRRADTDAVLALMTDDALFLTPGDGSAKVTRRGQTLTVFKRLDGRWLLHRDANLLAAPSAPADA